MIDKAALLDDLRAFTSACAALERHRAVLPASLLKLTSAAHTLAAVEAQRLQGRPVTTLDTSAERAALSDLERVVRELQEQASADALLIRDQHSV